MIPNDPAILLSFLNTKLRDFFIQILTICVTIWSLKEKTIEDKLSLIGYKYSEEKKSVYIKEQK